MTSCCNLPWIFKHHCAFENPASWRRCVFVCKRCVKQPETKGDVAADNVFCLGYHCLT